MNYEFYGTGQKTIVFLHGWGGSITSFKWFADALADEYKILNVDFAGFGKSEEPSVPCFVEDYARDLLKLINTLEIEKFFVVAHSFGGRVAIKLNTLTNKIAGFVLVDSAGIKSKFSFKKYIAIKRYKFAKLLVKCGILKSEILSKFGSGDYKNLSGTMKQTFVNVVNENLICDAKKIKVKTLILWGDKDTETPLYMAKRLNKNIVMSELFVFENCGHFCYLEKPILFFEILKNFFRSV